MNRVIRTGTSVIASRDEKPTASVLVQARGRNILPSCASSRNTGRNDTTMISSEKKMAGATCLAAASRMRFRKMPIAVLHHDDGRIDQNANGQRQPAQRHDVRADLQIVHREKRSDHG